MTGEHPLERVDVEPVRVDRDPDQPGTGRLERAERPGEGRCLDGHDIAGTEHRPRDEVDRLSGARRDHDLVGLVGKPMTGAAGGDLPAERREAFGIEVGEGLGPFLREDLRRDSREVADR